VIAMRASLLVLVLVGCGTQRDGTPSNAADAASVRVSPSDPLGALGLATASASDHQLWSYIPVNSEHPLVTLTDLPAGATVSAVGVRGASVRYTAGEKTDILFGCEQNTLTVTPLAGPRLPPGPAWILPRNTPSTWTPAALAIEQTRAAETSSRYAVGPLTIELTIELARSGPSRGTLAINRAGRTLHTLPFERAPIEGSPPELATIDLRSHGPGIPAPVGAWSFAATGPVLLVLLQPGWEGVTLTPFLVDESSARPIASMATYLYHCAF
jgi:hypothetical protein